MHGDLDWVWWAVHGFWLLVLVGAAAFVALVCWLRWRP